MTGPRPYRRVMTDAGWRCECRGECGRAHQARGSGGRCATGPRSPRPARTCVLSAVPTGDTGRDYIALCQPCRERLARIQSQADREAAAAVRRGTQTTLF